MSNNITSKLVRHYCTAVITATLLLLPFFFGGVHESTYLSFRAVLFLLIAILVTFKFSTISTVLSPKRVQGKVFYVIAALLLFLCIHSLVFLLIKAPHPVLGSTSSLFDPTATINLVLEFASFLSLFVITLFWLEIFRSEDSSPPALILYNLILVSSFLVALTALSHWFYDNGKLFWTFSPNFEGTSTRARWPFVNPNHLGIFLIIPLFLAIGRITQSWTKLKETAASLSRRGNIILTDILTSIESQKHTRSLLMLLLLVLCIGLAVIASLSRNAIFASSFCLLLFYLFPQTKPKKPVPVRLNESVDSFSETESTSNHIVRKRSKRRHTRESRNEFSGIDISSLLPYLRFFWKVSIVLATISVFWFFLGEKGGELFKSRVEYALLYTQDDMRWQLYTDSLPMIAANPIWGIGIGNWSALYPRFMAEGLSGMEPGFLHSDLLQAAIEFGLPGAILFLCAIIYISRLLLQVSAFAIQPQIASNKLIKINSRAALFGFLALILSASFEFPFRIPAICGLFAIALALAAYVEEPIS